MLTTNKKVMLFTLWASLQSPDFIHLGGKSSLFYHSKPLSCSLNRLFNYQSVCMKRGMIPERRTPQKVFNANNLDFEKHEYDRLDGLPLTYLLNFLPLGSSGLSSYWSLEMHWVANTFKVCSVIKASHFPIRTWNPLLHFQLLALVCPGRLPHTVPHTLH